MARTKILAGSLGLTLGITLVALANSTSRVPVLSESHAEQTTPDGGVGSAIPAPTHWVPFTAHMRKSVAANGVQDVKVQGRYYRRSDGSTRSESGMVNGPIKVIDIKNIAQNRFYLFENERWQSYPMLLPAEGFRPLQRREDMKGLERHSEAVSSFLVYKHTDRGGVVSMKAPDLNFFALRTSFKETTQEFYDVQLGEQPDDLFEPPVGAEVEQRTEFRGIISRKSAAALQQR